MENDVDTIASLQAFKNQTNQFKTQTGTALTYEKYYELLLSAATTNNKKFKRNTKFGSKPWRSVYDIEKFPNDEDENSFGIESSVDMILSYASKQQSSSSKIPKE